MQTYLRTNKGNAFASTFYFFADTQGNAKIMIRASKPTHRTVLTCSDRTLKVNNLEQTSYEPQTVVLRTNSRAADNIRLKEILKIKALFGNQTVVLLSNSGT